LDASVTLDGASEQMDGLDLGLLALVGEALRARDEGLRVGRISFEVYRLLGGHGDAKLAGERSTRGHFPMPDVTMYTTRTCPYCVAAKRLLSSRGIPFEEVDVSGDRDKRSWLVETTGRRTVPQIFIREQSIGGYEELAELDRSGELRTMLGGDAPPVEQATS
jgi:glutaredoxin 3